LEASFNPSFEVGATIIGIFGDLAQEMIPKPEEEKAFDGFAKSSKAFSDNVDIMKGSLTTYMETQIRFSRKLDPQSDEQWQSGEKNSIQEWFDNPSSYFSYIKDGKFAEPNKPAAGAKNQSDEMRAALAAPLINAIFHQNKYYVAKFNGRSFKDTLGFDLCDGDQIVFQDSVDPNGRACDEERNLYVILK
jgi:hypothetical protein